MTSLRIKAAIILLFLLLFLAANRPDSIDKAPEISGAFVAIDTEFMIIREIMSTVITVPLSCSATVR